MTRTELHDPFFDYLTQYFTDYLPSAKDSSPNTISSYRSTFKTLECYYTETAGKPFSTIKMTTLDGEFVEKFMAWLKNSRCNGPATIGVRLSALKSFLCFCASRDMLYTAQYNAVAAISSPTIPDKGLTYLTRDALQTIFSVPDAQSPKGLRDLTFMVLMYEAAARMQEMLDLRICDIKVDDGILCLWLTGKGRKRRVVPIGVKAARHLNRYLEVFHHENNINSEDSLFYTVIHGRRGRMSADCAEQFIKKHALVARKKCSDVPAKMHSHLYRHSRAMHLYQAGNDLITIRDFLGHTSIATTDIYARADTKMLLEAANKIVPSGSNDLKNWEDDSINKQLKDYLKLHGIE